MGIDEHFMERRIQALLEGIVTVLVEENVDQEIIGRAMVEAVTRALNVMAGEEVEGEDAALRDQSVRHLRNALQEVIGQ